MTLHHVLWHRSALQSWRFNVLSPLCTHLFIISMGNFSTNRSNHQPAASNHSPKWKLLSSQWSNLVNQFSQVRYLILTYYCLCNCVFVHFMCQNCTATIELLSRVTLVCAPPYGIQWIPAFFSLLFSFNRIIMKEKNHQTCFQPSSCVTN